MGLIEHIGQRIREFRTSYGGGTGISQQALAKALGVASNTVSRWETGTYQPTVNDLDRLARFFGKSIFEFWPDQNIRTERDERIQSLVRAAEQLPDEEVEELKRYAEYRKAQHIYTKRTVGRKAKK
ncbi:MAG: helix-turn-helix transcriptional regulator [Acidobacteria bacterium]|nr:helix-turn-helix transcriptional regulator [Acidobacteriota bacterium]